MSASPPEYYLVRNERLSEVREFSRLLSYAVVNYSKGNAAKSLTLLANISTHCARCNMRLNGEEFLSVGRPDDNGEKQAKIQRMQLGYCARSGCNADFCEVNFHRHPDLDWPDLFHEMENGLKDRESLLTTATAEKRVAMRKAFSQTMGRVGVGVALLCLLLLVWQWRRGGRIPILREPEKFRVTPVAPGQKERFQPIS